MDGGLVCSNRGTETRRPADLHYLLLSQRVYQYFVSPRQTIIRCALELILPRPNYIMLQRFLPVSAHQTRMHYQIFRNKNAKQELFDKVNILYKQVMIEDKGLAAGVQKNMDRGMFVNGQLHPRVEGATLHQQARAREAVTEHAAREQAAGRELWPAVRASSDDAVSKQDEDFCARLHSASGEQVPIEW